MVTCKQSSVYLHGGRDSLTGPQRPSSHDGVNGCNQTVSTQRERKESKEKENPFKSKVEVNIYSSGKITITQILQVVPKVLRAREVASEYYDIL